MSISPVNSSSSISHSSESGEELEPLSLELHELSEEIFNANFGDCEGVATDELIYLPAHGNKVLSLNSNDIGDCITMFGIGDDGSLFAWHVSTIRENTPSADFLNEFQDQCNKIQEGLYETLQNLSFDIYLVGGRKCGHSKNLCDGLLYINNEFFKNDNIAGHYLAPTDNTRKKYITVHFNTNAELCYYLHN